MIDRSPLWKRPGWMLLLILLAAGAGIWLAMDRPLPGDWEGPEGGPEIRLPEALRRGEAERLFCAESTETGVCRCINSDGQRIELSDEECRRRARASDTRPGSNT